MKLLKPQPLHAKYYEPIEVQLKDLIYRLIFDPLRAVIVSASLLHELKNAKTSALEAALIKGTVQYTDGVFSGKLSAAVSAELRKIGARFDKKMKVFKLEPGKVPAGVRVVAANRTMLARKLNDNLKLALDKIEEQLPQMIEKTTISYDKTVDRTTGDFKELYRQIEVTPIETDSAKAAMAKAYSERVKPFIKGWADEEILQLRQDMADNAQKGYRSEHMIAKIQKRYGASKAKAKFLARQETSLFMSNYRKLRFTSAGVKKFKWSTSGDSRVRDDHKALNGRIFDYANPPIIDSATGKHGLPGQGFGCRCVDIAIVEELNMKRSDAQGWQKDSSQIKSDRVQLWTRTGTMSGQIAKAQAVELVDSGECFVISDQAIGYFDMGTKENSFSDKSQRRAIGNAKYGSEIKNISFPPEVRAFIQKRFDDGMNAKHVVDALIDEPRFSQWVESFGANDYKLMEALEREFNR